MRWWMKSTMAWVEVPGRNISAMPDCFRAGMSASGMMPPTRTVTSVMPLSWRSFINWGQMVLWAPERMERPMTSTSSWTAAEAIISGVWRKPVYTTSMPASRKARAIIFAPRSWPSNPGLAISTRIFFCIISRYYYASGLAKRGPSVCQTVAAARVEELEVTVPLWFDVFDEHDILAARLADNLQDIAPRQGPETKVALTVSGFAAHAGLPDFIQNFFKGEAVFCIREVVVA